MMSPFPGGAVSRPQAASVAAMFWLAMVGATLMAVQGLDTIGYSIVEELSSGTYVGNIKVDAQLESEFTTQNLAQLRFSILPPDDDDVIIGNYFSVADDTGILEIKTPIDRDDVELCASRDQCVLTFDVAVGPAQYFRVISVNVEILDVNDNKPDFSQSDVRINLSESSDPGKMFNLPTAFDPDGPNFGIKRFELSPDNGQFNVRWTSDLTGKVQPKLELLQSIDRETIATFDLSLVAYDGGSPPNTDTLLVHVTVEDTNDNTPQFELPAYEARVFENDIPAYPLLSVSAQDPDMGDNGEVSYSLSANTLADYGDLFQIDSATGELRLKTSLDREERAVYYLSVVAKDFGSDGREATATVTVYVDDVNDNAPLVRVSVLSNTGRAEVLESADVGTFVALVSVTDRDAGRNADVACEVDSATFQLENLPPNKYKVVTVASLDRETLDRFDLDLNCRDDGVNVRVATERLSIHVIDVNDNAPVFTHAVYETRVRENNDVDTTIAQVTATDRDQAENAAVTYHISDPFQSRYFSLEPDTGVLRTRRTFDRENVTEIHVPIVAKDSGNPALTATSLVLVTIVDENDEAPVFDQASHTFVVVENQPGNSEMGQLVARDADAYPNDDVLYRLEAETAGALDHFALDAVTGILKTLEPLDRERQPFYHMTAVAYNNGTDLSGAASITVYVADENDNPPTIDFPSPANHTVPISNAHPVGYKVTDLRAHDMDTGENADLSFFLVPADPASGLSQSSAFSVDSKSGEIILQKDLSDIEIATYDLEILVKDRGVPELLTKANLTIIVNSSIPFLSFVAPTPDLHVYDVTSGTSSNMLIIIVVVAISGVLIIFLLGAIVFVLLKSRSKAPLQRNYLITASDSPPRSESDRGGGVSPGGWPGPADDPEDPAHDVSHSDKDSAFSGPFIGRTASYTPAHQESFSKPGAPSGNKTGNPGGGSVYVVCEVSSAPPAALPHPPPPGRGGPGVSLPAVHGGHRHQEERRVLPNLGAPELDRESSSSAELCHSDSGRGTSDDGDSQSGREPGSSRPLSNGSTTAVHTGPDYGLKHLQSQFDPHFHLKYSANANQARNGDARSSQRPSTSFAGSQNEAKAAANSRARHNRNRPSANEEARGTVSEKPPVVPSRRFRKDWPNGRRKNAKALPVPTAGVTSHDVTDADLAHARNYSNDVKVKDREVKMNVNVGPELTLTSQNGGSSSGSADVVTGPQDSRLYRQGAAGLSTFTDSASLLRYKTEASAARSPSDASSATSGCYVIGADDCADMRTLRQEVIV